MRDAVDHRIAVAHGHTLHVRERRGDGLPVVCLPGLARTLDDFEPLAAHLASPEGGARRVISISSRGRGLSDRDSDPSRYQVKQESEDALAVLDALGVNRAAFVGTSRGGLVTMMIAALKREMVAAAVLNDIGPEIELDGLIRIQSMLNSSALPDTFEQGAKWIRMANGDRFPALGADDWMRWARRAWRETDGRLEPACDPALSETLKGLDLTKPVPSAWPLFDALKGARLMIVRGELSDLFSEAQLGRMVERRPDAVVWRVAGQGHAPLLDDAPTMGAIASFLAAKG
ncbi:alpha/beta hydrolase [Chelatococcus sambhunathii]|uniref:Alpha/beta hydrolase n=1 Tax=Chelatococcus sambhunathii TaxID=363953 RepID=A0ABU1DK16_9HYPH|nr:alpha/beta hydrolase [Chelatococcus sambhunathii]MDR4308461.1 alpha/beta hydrolase [Chelatococcus sambhunathii]